jgi:hypothetical protein
MNTKACWDTDPTRRPTFQILSSLLSECIVALKNSPRTPLITPVSASRLPKRQHESVDSKHPPSLDSNPGFDHKQCLDKPTFGPSNLELNLGPQNSTMKPGITSPGLTVAGSEKTWEFFQLEPTKTQSDSGQIHQIEI